MEKINGNAVKKERTIKELGKALKEMKTGKAERIDKLNPEIIKY